MTSRERFQAVMNFQPFDRLPLVEWAGWWDQTIKRWHSEGLPSNVTDRYDICRHFGLEVYKQDWISPKAPPAPVHGAPVVRTMDEYQKIRGALYSPPVVDKDRWRAWAEEQHRGEVVLWFTLMGFFWFPRGLMGIEPHLYAFYDQPELMHAMNTDLVAWNLRIIEEICSVCTPDFMTFAEDMSYNNGPMLSQAQFNEFLKPYYRQIVPLLKERGILSIIDSDGDITRAGPWFEEAGLDGILPIERQAGADIARLRAAHPRMRFIGHFDKMTMNQGEAAMRAEFERLMPTAVTGGFLISCDHQTPPGVSYQDYQLYLRLFREYAEESGRCSRR
ncbi:MAG: hypothetical protein HY360_22260 [Verrucomicrobia bacterium]|nr:hypothetical protein [Verrucomicrobiota bacterium]